MTVLDINDNSPQFSRSSYQVYANEGESMLLSQLLIRVTDQDVGESKTIQEIIHSTNTGNYE